MIVSSQTTQEIGTAFCKALPKIMERLEPFRKKYRRSLIKRGIQGTEFNTEPHSIKVGHDTYLCFFTCSTSSKKSLGVAIFLSIINNLGFREYYHMMPGIEPVKITKHFIDRFIERSPYGATRETFLYYFIQDAGGFCVVSDGDQVFMKFNNGLGAIKNNTLITYMTDLCKTKEDIYSELSSYTPISRASAQRIQELQTNSGQFLSVKQLTNG